MHSREVEVRTRPPVPLQQGWEWWVDNPHRLAVRLRRDRSVTELARYQVAPGLHGAVVRRLRPRRPDWVLRAPVVIGCTAVALGAGALLRLLIVPLTVVAVVLLLAALYGGLRRGTGHRVVCAGLHCPGCRS